MASPIEPTPGEDSVHDAAWETNLKNVVDSHVQIGLSTLSELVLSQQQIRSQQSQMFQASQDKIRDNNLISHLASGGFKTIEEKLLDPDATEVANNALSTASGMSGLNSANQQTMQTIAQSIATMTGLMEQMNSRLESITRPAA